MSFKKYNLSDRGKAKLDGAIGVGDTTITLKNIENLPESNFTLTIFEEQNGKFVKSEKIYVATRSDTILSGVVRGYAGSTAKDFVDDSEVRMLIIAEHIIDVQNEVEKKVNKDGNKILTSNDFTNELLEKLNGLNKDEYAKLSGGNEFNGNQIFNEGNVGIGTSIPTNKLEIAGNNEAGGIKLKRSDSNKGIHLRSGTSANIIDSFGQKLYFKDENGGYNLSYSGGNVGIGTTNPQGKLNIIGDLQFGKNTDDYFVRIDNNGISFARTSASYIRQDREGYIRFLVKKSGSMINPLDISDTVQIKTSISLSDKQIYIRNHGDNSHGIKYNSSIDGPEMWGNKGTSLGDRNNHQIIKVFEGKTYIGQGIYNSVILRGRANTTDAVNSLNSLPNSSFIIAEDSGNIYFYIKGSDGIKRRITLVNNGTISTQTF